MSIPGWFIAAMASGRTRVGLVPAEKTPKLWPASWRHRPSAIWLLAELPVQRMRIRFGFVIKRAVAAKAPRSWAVMKTGASRGRIPEKVLVREPATGTAGLAKD